MTRSVWHTSDWKVMKCLWHMQAIRSLDSGKRRQHDQIRESGSARMGAAVFKHAVPGSSFETLPLLVPGTFPFALYQTIPIALSHPIPIPRSHTIPIL
jgi:hypothetical protein